jgi:hypothetical protein
MKRGMQKLIAGLLVVAGMAVTAHGQVQQSLSISLTIYNETNGIVRAVHLSTKDIIRYYVGTNVPGGKLWLVMPSDPSPNPGANDNIGAFMRITGNGGLVFDTSTAYFNVYQHSSSEAGSRITAWNQFSFDFGGFAAEVYGTATWSRGSKSAGGQGSFHCTVSGVANVGNGAFPCTGSVGGGAPRIAD